MTGLNTFADTLREARAALLNPDISESDRAHVVKVIEGALDLARLMEAQAGILQPEVTP